MSRCRFIYRIGYSWATGPRAEVQCQLDRHKTGLCRIKDPATGTILTVSSDKSRNVCLTPDVPVVSRPASGPFGPEIRLPLQFDIWSDYEAACRIARTKETLASEVNA